MSRTVPKSDRYLTAVLHAVFFLSGIATVLIGQVLPILSVRFSLDDLAAGNFFPAQFGGAITGTLLTNWFGRAGKLKAAAAAGSLLMALGVLMLASGLYSIVLLGFLVNGLGVGLTLPSINILILERNPERSAAALSFLNFFWGAGAIVAKPFVDLTAGPASMGTTLLSLALPLLLGAILLTFLRGEESAHRQQTSESSSGNRSVWAVPLAWLIAIFNFVHVGFESGSSGWLTTYADRAGAATVYGIVSPTLLYFLFFVAGRGIAPVYFRFLSESKVILLSLFVILAGLAITLTGSGPVQIGFGAAVCGLGTSAIFPTNIARFSRAFGVEAMRNAMPLFLAGTVGGAAVTWAIGLLSEKIGSLRAGMVVLVASILFLILLQAALMVRRFQQAE